MQSYLKNLKDTVTGLIDNPLARFAYTDDAFNNDDANGVEVFNVDADNNIPKETCTDYNNTVLQRGVLTQGASISRRAWNHFIGRSSYNLNKLVQIVHKLIGYLAASFAHNCFEYYPTAEYRQGDWCYILHLDAEEVRVKTVFRRVGNNPVKIVNISPAAPGQTEWELVPESTAVQALRDAKDYTDTQIVSTVAASQKWLPAVDTFNELNELYATTDLLKTCLCRVREEQADFQRIAGQPAWSIYNDNNDYVNETELADSIDNHDSSIIAHPTIRTAITAKADKVPGAVNGNFAALDSQGNLLDSGVNAQNLGGSGVKPVTLVIGTSAAGHTQGEVDYLCDGVNDGEEINAAIAALPVIGGKIVIREGTYNLSNRIVVHKDNVTLEGIKNATVLNVSVNTLSQGAVECTGTHCTIKGLTISNPSNVNVFVGIYIHDCDNSTVNSNQLLNSANANNTLCAGIWLKDSSNNVISENTCKCICNGQNIPGVLIGDGCNNNIITHNVLANMCSPTSSNVSSGICVHSSSYYNIIIGNLLLNSNSGSNNYGCGIFCYGSDNTIVGNTMRNRSINAASYGIFMGGSRNYIAGNIYANISDNSSRHNINDFGANNIIVEDALNKKAPLASPALTGTPTAPTAATSTNNTQIATTAFVKAAMAARDKVGTIYMSIDSENPTNFRGGTWTEWGQGRVPVGMNTSGTFTVVNTPGGSETHTLTVEQMPKHAHGSLTFAAAQLYGGTVGLYVGVGGGNTGETGGPTNGATGSAEAHNNMPPYITCYMWRKTAL